MGAKMMQNGDVIQRTLTIEKKKGYPILFLQPVLKSMVWGGERLRTDFGYDTLESHLGECWGISAHPNGDCQILNVEYSGKTLSRMWQEEPGFFGKFHSSRFPLLTKIIDAKKDLSIQVHPDDVYAGEREYGSLGKMECWYVVDCPAKAELVVGHEAASKEELEQMVQQGKWKELLRRVPIAPGDFIQIDPGTIHAITGGCLIVETQQNSDITYRLYDYDRKVDGKPRELHIQQSLDVIQVPSPSVEDSVQHTQEQPKNYWKSLVDCQYYQVYKLELAGSLTFTHNETFFNVTVVEGQGRVDGIPVEKGEHFIIPAIYGKVRVEGNMTLLASDAKDA